MDPRSLDYLLTDDEQYQFEENGYFVMEDALPPDQVARFREVTRDVVDEHRRVVRGPGLGREPLARGLAGGLQVDRRSEHPQVVRDAGVRVIYQHQPALAGVHLALC